MINSTEFEDKSFIKSTKPLHSFRRPIQPLKADGVFGGQSWWALDNPSGDAQRNSLKGQIPERLSSTRQLLLSILYDEHSKNVREIPDGSNRSPDIDGYWGNTGLKGYAWCCAFVSWALNETLGYLPIANTHHVGVMKMWKEARRLNLRVEKPRPGDVFIQDMGSGKGHTGFVVSVSPNGKTVYTCEGNSGNRLKLGKRSVSSIQYFVDAIGDNQSNDFERIDFSVKSLKGTNTR